MCIQFCTVVLSLVSIRFGSIHGLNEGNVVSLEHDPTHFLHGSAFQMHFCRVV